MTSTKILRGETIKEGDTQPPLRLQCLDSFEDPFNLTGYSVNIKVRRTDADTEKIDATATVEQEARGIVEYQWQSGDTDTAGTYLVELVADDGSDQITFPNDHYARIYVEDHL